MAIFNITDIASKTNVVFGTSGVRGLVAQMTPEVCAAYSCAFIQLLDNCPTRTVAIGIDLRPSSPDIARSCAAALKTRGWESEFCGALPTPALAFHAMQKGIPAIMVTGSHIPFDRNGIKFYRPEGEISKKDEAAITEAAVHLPEALTLPPYPAVNDAALKRYMARYLNFFPHGILSGMRVGLYQHSSVARDLLVTLLENLGAEVITLGRADTFVPIDTEAVSEEDKRRGSDWVREHHLDALMSTDGDADRPLLGDENGNWLRGDIVGLLGARYLHANAIVTPVSSNTAIEKSGWFKDVIRTRIGSPYVIEGIEGLLREPSNVVAGFEANGGFILGSAVSQYGRRLEPLPTRDAVLPLLALLAMARGRRIPLSALAADLPQRYTSSDRIQAIPIEQSNLLLHRLRNNPTPLTEIYGVINEIDETDGMRLTFTSGEIIHLRPSGNAPELRCYAEADSQKRAHELVMDVLANVNEWIA